ENFLRAKVFGKIAFLFLVFLSLSMQAQTQRIIGGQVFDSVTQKPLSGVAVYLNGTTFGTVTDQRGRFHLKAPRDLQVQLIISYLGYRPVRKHLPSRQDTIALGQIYLVEGQDLKPVYITADPWSR